MPTHLSKDEMATSMRLFLDRRVIAHGDRIVGNLMVVGQGCNKDA